MVSITISGLDESVEARLRVRAEARGHSMDEEVRDILEATLQPNDESIASVIARIRRDIEPVGGVDLELPNWGFVPEPPNFE